MDGFFVLTDEALLGQQTIRLTAVLETLSHTCRYEIKLILTFLCSPITNSVLGKVSVPDLSTKTL